MKNCNGKNISGIKKLIRPQFGTGETDKYGQPIVDWSFLSKYADEDGFDIRNIESNGNYKIEIVLPYGTEIIRFGNEMAHFTARKGTHYEDLALPYIKETVEYNEYRVIAQDLHIVCIVQKGKVAPGFDSVGGAIQYLHPTTIREAIKKGLLERM